MRVTIGQQIWFELRIPRYVRAMGLAPNDYFHGGVKNVTHAVPQYSATKRSWGFALPDRLYGPLGRSANLV